MLLGHIDVEYTETCFEYSNKDCTRGDNESGPQLCLSVVGRGNRNGGGRQREDRRGGEVNGGTHQWFRAMLNFSKLCEEHEVSWEPGLSTGRSLSHYGNAWEVLPASRFRGA